MTAVIDLDELLGTLARDGFGWEAAAACRDPSVDVDVFFPTPGRTADRQLAEELCARCPVRTPCLEEALADRRLTGIWGGTSQRQRVRIRRERRTGQVLGGERAS